MNFTSRISSFALLRIQGRLGQQTPYRSFLSNLTTLNEPRIRTEPLTEIFGDQFQYPDDLHNAASFVIL